MKDLNWVTGVKRLYYILWGLLVLTGVFGAIDLVINPQTRDSEKNFVWIIPIIVGLIPYGILKASQWIYAGLQSKQQ